jgi:hypothetical protein
LGQREWFEGLITSPSQPTYVGKSEGNIQTLDVVQNLE